MTKTTTAHHWQVGAIVKSVGKENKVVPTPGKASRHIRGTVGNSEAAHTVVPGKAGAHLAHRRLHARIANPRSQP
eukprot:6225139-Pyramimonas_sp.AAC.1